MFNTTSVYSMFQLSQYSLLSYSSNVHIMSIITTAGHTQPSLQPPAFDKARTTHLIPTILRPAPDEHLPIPEWDGNNHPPVKSVINKLERGAMPLPALLWDAYDPVRPRSLSQTLCFRTYSIWLAEEISEQENGDGVVVDEDDAAFLPTLCVHVR